MTRNGKIARLPRTLREELNRRLRDGEPGKQLVAWLNSHPKTQTVVKRQFGGRAINEQNLSEWKQGGYPEWLAHQETLERIRDFAANAVELTALTRDLSDQIAAVLAARYAAALAQWDGEPNSTVGRMIPTLHGLCQHIVLLRRGDHSAARLRLEQAWLELERSKEEARVQERFEEWVKKPEIKKRVCGKLTPEEQGQRLRQIFKRSANGPEQKGGISDETLAIIEREARLL
jgi:hypothetical protein